MPRTGFLGWVAQQQATFYAALTGALGRLKTDNNAFWVLGSLSFLYGIFHAAGPGHGKVVISSYVLANERQLRRGVMLSFLSAMLQSVVAVVFVGIAAAGLALTSTAMGERRELDRHRVLRARRAARPLADRAKALPVRARSSPRP